MNTCSHQGLFRLGVFLSVFLIYAPGCSINHAVLTEQPLVNRQAVNSLDTNWQVTFLHGTRLSYSSLVNLNAVTLTLFHQGLIRTVSVDSMTELRLVNRSQFWDRVKTGALIGSVAGAVLAAVITNPSSSGNPPNNRTETQVLGKFIAAIFFGLEGGLLGGFIGAIVNLVSSQDQIIDLASALPIQKPGIIRTFLVIHGITRPRIGF